MPAAQIPADEAERLATLLGYSILDTPREQAYDDLVLLAATIFEAPISLITLIDAERQWCKSYVTPKGEPFAREAPREISLCAHAILNPDQLAVVADCVQDARFADNPVVVCDEGIRFYAAAPLVAEGRALGTICVADHEPRASLNDRHEQALRALSRQVMAQLGQRRHLAQVSDLAEQRRDLSERDPLTGLYNRRFFRDELTRRLDHGGSGAMLLIDLDHFKAINDTLGHAAGDDVLMQVADTISRSVRAEDFVARLGGDEFALVLGRIDTDAIRAVVDKLSRAIEAINPSRGAPRETLAASIGGAMFTRGGSLAALLHEADGNMYAKKHGIKPRPPF